MNSNLLNTISHGESETIEFKTSFNDEVIISLVAFANTKGGEVYIGISDEREIKGINIGKEIIQNWINEIKNKTQPSIFPSVEIIECDKLQIVCFKVDEFPIKPLSFKGRYYKRVGNSNHQLNVSEISDIYLQTMQYSWDSYPYPNATIKYIDLKKVEAFIQKVNDAGRFKLPNNPKDALIKLRMLKDNIPTNSAMILFSKENLFYNVHIGRFKTPSLIIADKMINGNLFEVVEESMQTIVSHLKFAFEITGKTTQRTEIAEYPLDAIREALLNTLIHRDYQSSTDVQIKIFDKKITFYNPGGLFGKITEEDLKTNTYQASTRNKQIAEAFYLTGDIEKYGSGFIRIREAVNEYPTMLFNFINTPQGFVTEFSYEEQKTSTDIRKVKNNFTDNFTNNFTDNFTDNMSKILKLIDSNTNITQIEMADKLGISKRAIANNTNKLKEIGVLERIGSAKGGYWKIKVKS